MTFNFISDYTHGGWFVLHNPGFDVITLRWARGTSTRVRWHLTT